MRGINRLWCGLSALVSQSRSVSSGGGSITSADVYTAPSTAGSYTVTAISVASPSAKASASVTVNTTVSNKKERPAMTRYYGFLHVFAPVLLTACSRSGIAYPQQYDPPTLLATPSINIRTPNPGSLIVVINNRGEIAVDVASASGRWAYLDPDFHLLRYSNDSPDMGSLRSRYSNDSPDMGSSQFRYYTPDRLRIRLKGTPASDIPGLSIVLDGKFETHMVDYYVGGANVFPGEKRSEKCEMFSGEIRLLFNGRSLLKQKVANQPVDDQAFIGVNQKAGVLVFYYSQDASHHVESVYLIKLHDLAQSNEKPIQKFPDLDSGGAAVGKARPQ